jgi:NADH dehydrogenase
MDILILGGGYAGIACAARLAHRLKAQSTPARIRLVNPGASLVERIRLHQAAAGQDLPERAITPLLGPLGVDVLRGHAQSIDLHGRTATVDGEPLPWDRLVLALGSHIAAPPGAWTLDPGRVADLQERLWSLPAGAHVAVVGGGLTGIEAASEVAEHFPHLLVHLFAEGSIAAGFRADARDHVLRTLGERLRVQLHEHTAVRNVRPGELDTTEGPIPAEACVWAAGFAAHPLAADSGLRTNGKDQVLVDPFLRSVSHPQVYAAGDLAAPVLPPGQPLPMGCKSAMPMGAHVADNIAREIARQPLLPFDYALLFYCVSLGRRDGLIQWADDAGALTGRVLTGRRAAVLKELVCRSTWWALRLEAKGRKAVVWKRTGRAPSQLPVDNAALS